MEEQSGPSGWTTVGQSPRPGEIRLWTYQAIAHGADAIVYFRWRTARFGTEEYWHGVLDHDAHPRRRYQEVKQTGAELGRVGDRFRGAESRSTVAMILSYDTRFAFQIQPNHPDFKYSKLFGSYYAALHRRNLGVDIVPPLADLAHYELVMAPGLYVLDEDAAANLRRYVQNGGTLLVTARSGVKDKTNTVVDLPLPGLLSELCGVEVDEYDTLPAGAGVPLEAEMPGLIPAGETLAGELWCDVLHPTTAQTLLRYGGQYYYAGRPAATLNHYGQGHAIYVGTFGADALQDALLGWLVHGGQPRPGAGHASWRRGRGALEGRGAPAVPAQP